MGKKTSSTATSSNIRKKNTKNDNSMISPTGVADFLQVDSNVMKQNMNGSFSWTDCPIHVDAAPSTLSWAVSGATTTTSTTTFPESKRTISSSVSTRLSQMEQRLQWLQRQRMQDQDDYQMQLQQAKEQMRVEFYETHSKEFGKERKNYDGQVSETSKIINYLKQDNTKVRDEIKGLKRNMIKLKQTNDDLEQANASAKASIDALQQHVNEMEVVQSKLQTNCQIFKDTLAKMKKDYHQRNSFYKMERTTTQMYELCLAKVLAQVHQYASSNSTGSSSTKTTVQLEHQLYDMVTEAASTVGDGRRKQLQKNGHQLHLELEPYQVQQVERLTNPEMLVEYHHRLIKQRTSSGDDSDSDNDSDSESGYESESSNDKNNKE